ncbi:hypothetical protein E2P81_ATG07890 [Venturia nashicola]|uniref:Uncharacterized protein n=1 Tax=Venturia nashicola TaxID=86259 RepID=A0A4Z1NR82_9PEZI|nr:hypothetical protein E6O75_ATG08060 [Venturia nashicola]TLD26078.1 hypothetical protein E2P81_ATG07890 [Venturia nashicola]
MNTLKRTDSTIVITVQDKAGIQPVQEKLWTKEVKKALGPRYGISISVGEEAPPVSSLQSPVFSLQENAILGSFVFFFGVVTKSRSAFVAENCRGNLSFPIGDLVSDRKAKPRLPTTPM